jgi:SPX domain protein involved in polyphosphate accumulation
MNYLNSVPTPKVEDFSRYEFKYLLSQNRRQEIEDELSHFMEFDGHIHEDLENAYIVRSLYFDSREATHYYEKTDGLRTRKKYRIRTYGHEWSEDLPIYLEEKGRYKERTFKHRIQIKLEEIPIFCNAERRFELLERYPGIPLIEEFVFNTIRRSTNPVVLVDYLRRPFMSQYDMNFRVTFDSHLRAAATDRLFPDERASWLASDAGYTIVEIKFFRRIPAWFHRIIQAHNLRRLSISKFCRGMEVCGLATNLE